MLVGSLGRHWAKWALLCVVLGLLAIPALAQHENAPLPSAEVFGGVSYFAPNARFLKSDTSDAPKMMGWGTSVYSPFSRDVGGVFDVSGNYGSGSSLHSVLFGAEYKPRKWKLEPFGEGMFGWARRSPKDLPSQGAAAFLGGGGLDFRKDNRFSIRLIRADYIRTFDNPNSSGANQQAHWNSIRIQSGIVMTFGEAPEEHEVAVACTATPGQVHAGEPVNASLSANGFVRSRKVRYAWQLNDRTLSSTSRTAVIETASLPPGDYTIKATASDNAKGKHHQAASCKATFAVLQLRKQEAPAAGEAQAVTDTPAKPEGQPAAEISAATESQIAAKPSTIEVKTSANSRQASATDNAPAPAPSSSARPEAEPAQAPTTNNEAPQSQPAPSSSSVPNVSLQQNPGTQGNVATQSRAVEASPVILSSSKIDRAKSSRKKQPRGKKALAAARPTASTQPGTEEPPSATPPHAAVVPTPATVVSGNPVTLTVRTQTSEGTSIAPICKTSSGTLHGGNGTYTLDTVGIPAGKVIVTCTESDGRMLGRAFIDVTPTTKTSAQTRKLNSVRFKDVKRPARVDNVAKQILRDAAHALQQSETGSKLILVGNARATEREANKNLAAQRAANAKAFLMDAQNGGGVDASSIAVYSGKAPAPRVDIYLAAPGAVFNADGKFLATGAENRSSPKKIARHHRRVLEK